MFVSFVTGIVYTKLRYQCHVEIYFSPYFLFVYVRTQIGLRASSEFSVSDADR